MFVQPAVWCLSRFYRNAPLPPRACVYLESKTNKFDRLIYGVRLVAVTAERKQRKLKSALNAVKRHLWPRAEPSHALFLSQAAWKKTFIGFNPSLEP